MKTQIVLVLILILTNTDVSIAQKKKPFRGIELEHYEKGKIRHIKESKKCTVIVKDGSQVYEGNYTIINDSTLLFKQGEVLIKDIEVIYVHKIRRIFITGSVVAVVGAALLVASIDDYGNARGYERLGGGGIVMIVVSGIVTGLGLVGIGIGLLRETSYQKEHWTYTIVE